MLGLSSGPLCTALHTASPLLGLPASSMLLRSFCQEISSPDLPLTLSSPAQTLRGFQLPQDIQVLTSWTDLYACSHRLVYSFLHSVRTERVLCTRSWSESAQSCPILCDPVDCSPLGSSVHEILQARVLESFAILFSRGSSPPRDQTRVYRIVGRFFTI